MSWLKLTNIRSSKKFPWWQKKLKDNIKNSLLLNSLPPLRAAIESKKPLNMDFERLRTAVLSQKLQLVKILRSMNEHGQHKEVAILVEMLASGSPKEFWKNGMATEYTRAIVSSTESILALKGRLMRAILSYSIGTKENPINIKRSNISFFMEILGLILLIGLLIFVAQSYSSGMGDSEISQFINSPFSQVRAPNVKFSDVVGNYEAKEDMQDLVEYLRNPTKFANVEFPTGILLVGPPGCGKTLMARALAGEAGVPFFTASGAEFDEIFVGVGARRVRQLFETARKNAPCIIFIDEIDAMGSSRKKKVRRVGRTDSTLNQLLVELDGFKSRDGVLVIAATNLPNGLDEALVRPGRFDRKVYVNLPELKERKEILDYYLSKYRLAPTVNTLLLAKQTPGMSGADLESIVDWATLTSYKELAEKSRKQQEEQKKNNNTITNTNNNNNNNQSAPNLPEATAAGIPSSPSSPNLTKKVLTLNMNHLEDALLNVAMGRTKKAFVVSERVRSSTAYHEGGHALAALFTPGAEEIRKATILPRGPALGMVSFLNSDTKTRTKKQFLANLRVAMAGTVAEELIFGPDEVSAGASSDIEQATKTAYAMVSQYGMSDFVGHVHIEDKSEKVDDQVRILLEEAYKDTKQLLTKHRTELERLAQALLKYETLDKSEIQRVIQGETLNDRTLLDVSPPTLVLL